MSRLRGRICILDSIKLCLSSLSGTYCFMANSLDVIYGLAVSNGYVYRAEYYHPDE